MEPPELLAEEIIEEYIEEVPESLEDEDPSILARLRSDYALIGLLVLAITINFALLGYLLVSYEAIPDPLPLHFDAAGLPDRIGSKSDIWALPSIGLIVFGINVGLGLLAYRRERAAALILTAGSIFVQILMWMAALNVTGGI